MKYKNYGDNNKYSKGTDLELLNVEDSVSARSINRPIINLYENQEETYKLLNTLLKTVYGNAGDAREAKAIIPDIYEEFAPDGFLINSFAKTDRYFLRIPTGAALLSKNSLNKGDIYSYSDTNYKDFNSENKYSKDKWKSFAYVNRPNINILERQLASFMDLNLDNSYNDIKIETQELPVTYLVYKIDQDTDLPILMPNGNIEHLIDKNERALYICEKNKANYYVENKKIFYEERNIEYAGGLKTEDKTFKKYYYYNIEPDEIKDYSEAAPEDSTFLTYRLEDASYSTDSNGNPRKCIGYYLNISETTAQFKKTSYLPNKKKEAYIDILLNGTGTISVTNYDINFKEKEEIKGTISFNVKSNMTSKEISESLVNAINSSNNPSTNKLKINAELIKEGDSKYGAKITFKDSFVNNYDNYSVGITANESIVVDYKNINKAVRQEYYRNIFELTNDFLARFKSDIVSTNYIPEFLNGETLLELKKSINDYYIYYNLSDKKPKEKSDNSEKLIISDIELENDNYVKLFKVSVEWNPELDNKSPKVTGIQYFIKRLDKRLIKTKRAELQTLYTSLRTNLDGDFTADALDKNRYIKMLSGTGDNQIRIKAPVLRISTGKSTESFKENSIGENFNSPSFNERDYINGKETTYYGSSENAGIAIDESKGVQIYDGTSNTNSVVELLSNNGKINLITDNEASAITLKNNKDSPTNSIDLIGLTKLSSKNDNQLTIEATDKLKSTTVDFKENENELGHIQFKKVTEENSEVIHNVLKVDNKEFLDSTNENTKITNTNIELNGVTNQKGNFTAKSGESKIDLTSDIGIVSSAESGKKIKSKITEDTYSQLEVDKIENTVGHNSTTINANGSIVTTADSSISNTVTSGSISNTVTSGSISNSVTTGNIENNASTYIKDAAGKNSITINGTTGDDNTANSIVTTSANTTIDNETGSATIKIGNNESGKKTIKIGNAVDGSSVTVNAGVGKTDKINLNGKTDITGETNINTSGAGKTTIGNSSSEFYINAGTIGLSGNYTHIGEFIAKNKTENPDSVFELKNNYINSKSGSNSIVINGNTGERNNPNSITTTSATTTIDNGAGPANIGIGNNTDGKKTITIGNDAAESSVLIKGKAGNLISINSDKSNEINITSPKVKVTGDIEAFKNLTTNSAVDVENITTLKNTLEVTGATNLGGGLTVSGDHLTTLKSTLGVTGATSLENNLTVKKATNLEGGLKVSGDHLTTLNNILVVTGETSLENNLTVKKATILGGGLTVSGDHLTTLKSTLGVTGATSLENNLTVKKATNLEGGLKVSGDHLTTLNNILGVTGETSLENNLTVKKATILEGGLTVSGNHQTTLNNILGVTGETSLENNLTVKKATILGGGLTVSGDHQTTLNNILGVTGETKFSSDLTVSGAASLASLTAGDTNVTKISSVGNVVSIGSLKVTNSASLGSLTVNNDATFGKITEVTGGTTINGGLTVKGNAEVGSSNSGNTEASGTLLVHGLATFNSGISIPAGKNIKLGNAYVKADSTGNIKFSW